jgi:3-methyladenine DNA glycosylase AlkC
MYATAGPGTPLASAGVYAQLADDDDNLEEEVEDEDGGATGNQMLYRDDQPMADGDPLKNLFESAARTIWTGQEKKRKFDEEQVKNAVYEPAVQHYVAQANTILGRATDAELSVRQLSEQVKEITQKNEQLAQQLQQRINQTSANDKATLADLKRRLDQADGARLAIETVAVQQLASLLLDFNQRSNGGDNAPWNEEDVKNWLQRSPRWKVALWLGEARIMTFPATSPFAEVADDISVAFATVVRSVVNNTLVALRENMIAQGNVLQDLRKRYGRVIGDEASSRVTQAILNLTRSVNAIEAYGRRVMSPDVNEIFNALFNVADTKRLRLSFLSLYCTRISFPTPQELGLKGDQFKRYNNWLTRLMSYEIFTQTRKAEASQAAYTLPRNVAAIYASYLLGAVIVACITDTWQNVSPHDAIMAYINDSNLPNDISGVLEQLQVGRAFNLIQDKQLILGTSTLDLSEKIRAVANTYPLLPYGTVDVPRALLEDNVRLVDSKRNAAGQRQPQQ